MIWQDVFSTEPECDYVILPSNNYAKKNERRSGLEKVGVFFM